MGDMKEERNSVRMMRKQVCSLVNGRTRNISPQCGSWVKVTTTSHDTKTTNKKSKGLANWVSDTSPITAVNSNHNITSWLKKSHAPLTWTCLLTPNKPQAGGGAKPPADICKRKLFMSYVCLSMNLFYMSHHLKPCHTALLLEGTTANPSGTAGRKYLQNQEWDLRPSVCWENITAHRLNIHQRYYERMKTVAVSQMAH